MLTIGIVFWDGDYQNYDSMMERIKERVHIPYEVITIDNTTGGKLKDKATYSFGYNAYQFAARYRILERAKGDYVWFIDGDDDICEVNEIGGTEDIIVFAVTAAGYKVNYENAVIDQNIFTFETGHRILPVLWNKFIKRSLFDMQFMTPYKDLKIVTNEDVLWCYLALKRARSIRTIAKQLYVHKEGRSNRYWQVPLSNIQHLTTGYRELINIAYKLIGDEGFHRKMVQHVQSWLLAMAFCCVDIVGALSILHPLITVVEMKRCFELAIPMVPQINNKEEIKAAIKAKYGDDFFMRTVTTHNRFDDGHEEDVTIHEEWW